MTVITGESGAGKSILLGALGLVLGDRAASDAGPPGAERSDVTAEFDLRQPPGALQQLEALTIPTSLVAAWCGGWSAATGARARSSTVPRPPCRRCAACARGWSTSMGSIENARLTRRDVQLELLDDFGVDTDLRRACRDSFRAWKRAGPEAAELGRTLDARKDRADLLAYQLEELDELGLAPGEYGRVGVEHRRLSQAQTLRETAARQHGGAHARTSRSAAPCACWTAWTTTIRGLSAARETLHAAEQLVADAVRDLRAYDDSLELDPEHLESLDRRLADIHDVARKHRVQPAALAEHMAGLRAELDELSTDRSALEALSRPPSADRKAVPRRGPEASAGHAARLQRVRNRGEPVHEHARHPRRRPHAGIRRRPDRGRPRIGRIPRQTNPKYPAGPLTRIASGGERARISLAIQVVAAPDRRSLAWC